THRAVCQSATSQLADQHKHFRRHHDYEKWHESGGSVRKTPVARRPVVAESDVGDEPATSATPLTGSASRGMFAPRWGRYPTALPGRTGRPHVAVYGPFPGIV